MIHCSYNNKHNHHFLPVHLPTLLFSRSSQVDNTTFRLTASLPKGCQRSECSFFLGINTNKQNNQFLDFVVEGKAEAWVAVGFTLTPDMVRVWGWGSLSFLFLPFPISLFFHFLILSSPSYLPSLLPPPPSPSPTSSQLQTWWGAIVTHLLGR